MPPDLICVTSLFTYSWSPVHEVVSRYRSLFPRARVQVGGIYASLMPEHAASTGAEIHTGLLPEAEDFAPDYSLVPSWDASILFSSRGCVRRCAFCSVPKIEPDFHCQPSIAGRGDCGTYSPNVSGTSGIRYRFVSYHARCRRRDTG